MARFFFNVYNGLGLAEDPEGRDLPDLDAARAEAIKGARSIIREDVVSGRIDLRGRVEVIDDGGRLVLNLSFADTVQILRD